MYYAYILRSLKDNRYYYGHTSDLDGRLKQHNMRKVRATKGRVPWVLHYSESFETRSQSVKRELFFKTIDGYLWLKKQGTI